MAMLHRWTTDLLVVALWAGVALSASIAPNVLPPPVRIILYLPVLLLFPGYVVVNLLYPDRPLDLPGNDGSANTVGGTARLVLSVSLSVAIVPGIAFAMNFTPVGIVPGPVVLVSCAVAIVGALVGLLARARLPAERRFQLEVLHWMSALPARSFRTGRQHLQPKGLFEAETGTQRLLNVVLVGALLVFGVSVAFAATVPQSPAADAEFTEYYLLSEDDSGELVASGYPTSFDGGESRPITVAIENHEGEPRTYTTVVKLQRVDIAGDVRQVEEEAVIDEFETRVDAGETARTERSIEPTMTGEDLQVVFLLYRGEPPATPTVDNAYRDTRLVITVGGSGGGGDLIEPGPTTD